MSQNRFNQALVILAIMLLGLIVRLTYLMQQGWGGIESDEAIVGLMAKHIAEGRGVPAFYYGQHYMGSLESILVAVMFLFLGPTAFALKLVPLILSVLSLGLFGLLLWRIYGARAAINGGILFAVPAPFILSWSLKARGGYIELLFLGLLVMLLTAEWLEKREKRTLCFVGMLCGLMWWTNFQSIYLLLALGVIIIPGISWRDFGFGVVAFLVGSAPFIYYNLVNNFVSLTAILNGGGGVADYGGLFKVGLPVFFGLRKEWTLEWLMPLWLLLGVGLCAAVFLCLYGKRIWSSLVSNQVREKILILQLLIVFIGLMIFLSTSFGQLVVSPRYLFLLTIPVLYLQAIVLSQVPRVVTIVTILIVASFYLQHSFYKLDQPFVAHGERASDDHSELYAWLKENKVSAIRTNYWIGYRIAFETNESTVFAQVFDPIQVRIDQYEAFTKGLDPISVPWVLTNSQADKISAAFDELGISYEVVGLSGYKVINNLSYRVASENFISKAKYNVISTINTAALPLLEDDNLETRWSTARPQRSGDSITVTFHEPTTIGGIILNTAKWFHDYPRALCISQFSFDQQLYSQKLDFLASPETRAALLTLGPSLPIHLSPLPTTHLTITLLAPDPIYDWSIAELISFRDIK